MIFEAVLFIIGFYLFAGISIYIYSVFKTYDILGTWNFKIINGYVGLCKYPRWTLFWLEKIVMFLSMKFK